MKAIVKNKEVITINEMKGGVEVMNKSKIAELAEAEFKAFMNEESLFQKVGKFKELFGKDYEIELRYCDYNEKRIKRRIITKIVNKGKRTKEKKELLKVLKAEELKLNLMNGCYVVVEECNDFKGLKGLEIEAMWGSIGDILTIKSDNGLFNNQDFIFEEIVNESIDRVISELKSFGIYELIQKGV